MSETSESEPDTTTTGTEDRQAGPATPTAPSATWSGWPHRPVYFDGDGLLCLRLLCGNINDLATTRSELYRKAVGQLQDRYLDEFQSRWSASAEVSAYSEVSGRLGVAIRDLEVALTAREAIKKRKAAAVLAQSGSKAAAALAKAKTVQDANKVEVVNLRELVALLVPEAENARAAAMAKREELLRELCREAFTRYESEVQNSLKELCNQAALLDRLAVALRTCSMSDALADFLRPPELPMPPMPPPEAFDVPEYDDKSAYSFPQPEPPPEPPKPRRQQFPNDEWAVWDGARLRRGFVSQEEAEDYASTRPGSTIRKISGPGSQTETAWAGPG
jgi:hypothetical protein